MSILKLKLKRVDPVKYATISAILTVSVLLIIFLPFFLLFSAIGITATESMGPAAAIFGGSIFFILFLPIIYGALVFIITLIITLLLNYILKKTGGLELNFEKSDLDIRRVDE